MQVGHGRGPRRLTGGDAPAHGHQAGLVDAVPLLDEMLDAWERTSVDEVIQRVEAGGGGPEARLKRLSALAGSRGGQALKIDLAVRAWARRDRRVATRLRRVDNRRMAYLRDLISKIAGDTTEIEAKAMLAFSLIIGNHVIAADHPRSTRGRVVQDATRLLFG